MGAGVSGDRRRPQPLVQRLALVACRIGNDPHNQEIAQCLLEDYAKNRGFDRERLLLACAHTRRSIANTGISWRPACRFGQAMKITELQ